MATKNELKTLPLNHLVAWKDNPRKIFDDIYIEELAQSIKANGVFENLIVMPVKGKKNKYEIISGECRFRAMKRLVKDGAISKDYDVPVIIRKGLEAVEAMRLAVLVNIQRKDMHPMDEAHAVAGLVHDGVSLDEISEQTGLSLDVIRRRIALTSLCEEAQEAVRKGDISITVGQALTLGTHDRQRQLLEEGLKGVSADRVIRQITNDAVALSSAIFPVDKYAGNITRDLFFEEDNSFFEDIEQFFALQDEAVEQLKKKKLEAGFSPVEIYKERWFSSYEYRKAREGETGGCVIHYSPDGDVTVHEGLINRELDAKTCDKIKEKKPALTYSAPLQEYIGMQKSIAVQNALLCDPRKAKEVAVVMMLIEQQLHRCHTYFDKLDEKPEALKRINEFVYPLFVSAGFDIDNKDDALTVFKSIGYVSEPDLYDYEAIKMLSDAELDQLHLLLTTLYFGQSVKELDTDENSLFNLVANDLGIDMRNYWTPDMFFLSRLKPDSLQEIITETETSHQFGKARNHKKKDIVSMMAKYFEKLASIGIPDEQHQKAKNWLPDVFLFPAIDPDQADDAPVSEDDLDEVA